MNIVILLVLNLGFMKYGITVWYTNMTANHNMVACGMLGFQAHLDVALKSLITSFDQLMTKECHCHHS